MTKSLTTTFSTEVYRHTGDLVYCNSKEYHDVNFVIPVVSGEYEILFEPDSPMVNLLHIRNILPIAEYDADTDLWRLKGSKDFDTFKKLDITGWLVKHEY